MKAKIVIRKGRRPKNNSEIKGNRIGLTEPHHDSINVRLIKEF
jgi:hypothetical protein